MVTTLAKQLLSNRLKADNMERAFPCVATAALHRSLSCLVNCARLNITMQLAHDQTGLTATTIRVPLIPHSGVYSASVCRSAKLWNFDCPPVSSCVPSSGSPHTISSHTVPNQPTYSYKSPRNACFAAQARSPQPGSSISSSSQSPIPHAISSSSMSTRCRLELCKPGSTLWSESKAL